MKYPKNKKHHLVDVRLYCFFFFFTPFMLHFVGVAVHVVSHIHSRLVFNRKHVLCLNLRCEYCKFFVPVLLIYEVHFARWLKHSGWNLARFVHRFYFPSTMFKSWKHHFSSLLLERAAGGSHEPCHFILVCCAGVCSLSVLFGCGQLLSQVWKRGCAHVFVLVQITKPACRRNYFGEQHLK